MSDEIEEDSVSRLLKAMDSCLSTSDVVQLLKTSIDKSWGGLFEIVYHENNYLRVKVKDQYFGLFFEKEAAPIESE